jgi:hypothetical protein
MNTFKKSSLFAITEVVLARAQSYEIR